MVSDCRFTALSVFFVPLHLAETFVLMGEIMI